MNAPSERAEAIALGFDIADGEQVSLAYDGDELVLQFVDWREEQIRVAFRDTVAFTWQRAERAVATGERYDGTNVVHESAWLTAHRQQGEARPEHRHLRLNFNAAGVLEVICVEVTVG